MLCSDQIEKTESKETSSKQTNENWIPTGETRQNPSAVSDMCTCHKTLGIDSND